MQAARTESAVGGVEPPVTLPVPPRMPSLPSVPSRAPTLLLPPIGVVLLVRTMGADVPLRPLLRRGFETVVQPEMPCAWASSVGAVRRWAQALAQRSIRGAHRRVLLWKLLG